MDDVAAAQRRMWTVGDYPTIAAHLLPISLETVDALRLRPGDTVLDVGVGDGNAAIAAARAGAYVTGIDLAPAQIERARARSASEGVELVLQVGDAQRLDFPDATFDVVVSVLGMIFAPDHRAALAEMARVCVPGGTVAMAAWSTAGWGAAWSGRAARFLPPRPPGGSSPNDWGDPEEVRRRFKAAHLDVKVEERRFFFRFPSEEACLETFLTKAGPFVTFMEAAERAGHAAEAREELRAVLSSFNRAADGTCLLRAPYLLAIARR